MPDKLFCWICDTQQETLVVLATGTTDDMGDVESRACGQAVKLYNDLLIAPIQLRDFLEYIITVRPKQVAWEQGHTCTRAFVASD